MNIFALAPGVLSLTAFISRSTVGNKEYQLIKSKSSSGNSKYTYSWIQGRSGWHWVSVDLTLCVTESL